MQVETTNNAVILIDFPNVKRVTGELIGDPGHATEIVHRVANELRIHATRTLGLNVIRTIAISTVSNTDSSSPVLQQSVLADGVEIRIVYCAEKERASSIELALAASDIARSTANIDSYVILSGDRWYVPLVQYLKRHGRSVVVASLEIPTAADQVPSDVAGCFFNARTLLQRAGQFETNGIHSSANEHFDEDADSKKPEETFPIDDSIARQGMEIIEQYFGQYKEVYLTPLLRKLTEQLQEEEEPKTVVNYLEECGAVWLEKRRGFPHNYTVLLVNQDHPDVLEIKEAFKENDEETQFESEYADGNYGEDSIDGQGDIFRAPESKFEDAHD